jgi:hypothetical protein
MPDPVQAHMTSHAGSREEPQQAEVMLEAPTSHSVSNKGKPPVLLRPSDVEAAVRAAVEEAQRKSIGNAGACDLVCLAATKHGHDCDSVELPLQQGVTTNSSDDDEGVRSDYERVDSSAGTGHGGATEHHAQASASSRHVDSLHEHKILDTSGHRSQRLLELASFDDLRRRPDWSVYAHTGEVGGKEAAANDQDTRLRHEDTLQALIERKKVVSALPELNASFTCSMTRKP